MGSSSTDIDLKVLGRDTEGTNSTPGSYQPYELLEDIDNCKSSQKKSHSPRSAWIKCLLRLRL